MSFVFYDTETTGTNTWFDQILQFAAIKTDAEFKELDRFEIRCRLLPHVVPSPGAMRVTGIKASQLTDVSFCSHYEMVRAIQSKLMSWSPATFIGYNSLEYDEDLMRQALYQTLHAPYLTNTNGNSRSDVLRMAHACNLFAPDALTIPVGESGRQSFKLDRLAPVNGFNHDRAHDAMGDVEATIHLCRLICERAPNVWSTFMRFARKAAVIDFITSETVFCLNEIYFGRAYSYLVTSIGQDTKNPNEWYLYDLAIAPASLQQLSQDQLVARLAQPPKPFKTLKSNGVPILFPADEAPTTCKGHEYGLAELEQRASAVKNDIEFRQRLIAAYQSNKTEYPPSPHVEHQIYDGFFSGEQKLMDAFHTVPWEQRISIVEQFKDLRLKTIGWRLIHTERPDLIDDVACNQHDEEVADRLMGTGNDIPWLTIPNALSDLEKIVATASESEATLLAEHKAYLLSRLNGLTQKRLIYPEIIV